MTLQLVEPPKPRTKPKPRSSAPPATRRAAADEAWGIVMDGIGQALTIPDLPSEDFTRLRRCYALAAALAHRPRLRAEGGA